MQSYLTTIVNKITLDFTQALLPPDGIILTLMTPEDVDVTVAPEAPAGPAALTPAAPIADDDGIAAEEEFPTRAENPEESATISSTAFRVWSAVVFAALVIRGMTDARGESAVVGNADAATTRS